MGLFDNAKTVMIGNKEVQSIKVTSNNAVLYEKQAQDNYLLTLTSNKDILSYYDNESATLTATLTNNNVPVSGEKVVFSFPRDENYTSKSITANTETTVGRKYIINTTFPENYRSTTYLDSEHKVAIVTSAGDGAALYIDGEQRSNDFTTNFSVDEGILTCSSGTFDCTSYDMSVIKSTINLNISDYGGHVRSTTDSNGECSVSYNSKGAGDINITVKCMNLTETYSIEDIYFFRSQEYSYTKTSSNDLNTFIDNTTSFDLPPAFELTFDYKSTGAASSSDEHRVFIMPRSLYVQNTQPSTAMMVGNVNCGRPAHIGVRRDGSKTTDASQSFTCDTFHQFKITRSLNNNNIYFYYDSNYVDYWGLPLANNYQDWCFCFHMWSAGTVTIRNIKLKAL